MTRVGVGGKRSFDPADKRRLVDACLEPGASLSGLALKAGVNANQLHKWVRQHEQSKAPARDGMSGAWSAFVPVVAIDDPGPLLSLAIEAFMTCSSELPLIGIMVDAPTALQLIQ